MYRVATRMVGDSEDVSDIIQEIFIDFFNKTKNGIIRENIIPVRFVPMVKPRK